MLLFCSTIGYSQTDNTLSVTQIKAIERNATEALSYLEQAAKTAFVADARIQLQNSAKAAKEAEMATAKVFQLLVEKERTVSNSGDKVLIENIKDQREEMDRAVKESKLVCLYIEKALESKDFESMHENAVDASKSTKKVIKLLAATLQFASSIK